MKKYKLLSIFISSLAILNPFNLNVCAKSNLKTVLGATAAAGGTAGVVISGVLIVNKLKQNKEKSSQINLSDKKTTATDNKIIVDTSTKGSVNISGTEYEKNADVSMPIECVASIFEEKTVCNWGFRGDPFFWDFVQMSFQNYKNCEELKNIKQINSKELEQIIKMLHKKATGVDLTSSSMANLNTSIMKQICASFTPGESMVSGQKWTEEIIPILQARLKNLKK